jgi:hypothetical protein
MMSRTTNVDAGVSPTARNARSDPSTPVWSRSSEASFVWSLFSPINSTASVENAAPTTRNR